MKKLKIKMENDSAKYKIEVTNFKF